MKLIKQRHWLPTTKASRNFIPLKEIQKISWKFGNKELKMKQKPLALIGVLAIAVVVLFVWKSVKAGAEDAIMTGIVETNQIDVSSKIPGRLERVMYHEGDMVKKGDTLFTLESKELDAKLAQGKGLSEAAYQKFLMATNGARPEEIAGAEDLYMQAKAQYELMDKTFARIKKLHAEEVVSTQDKDQVEAQYKAAKEAMEAAKARFDMVKKGARAEEIAGANALYQQAANVYNEILAAYKELAIVAPSQGEVYKVLNDPGEVVPAGFPVVSLVNLDDMYIVLQIREDQMARVKKGQYFKVDVPALGLQNSQFKVSYIAVMADFATWKATNQKGDFDLKTFEVRLKPEQPLQGLRPGMTVHVKMN
jgi:HlyD family secretion protein